MPHRSTAAPPLCAAALLAACAGAAPGAATSSAARADTLETVLYLIGDAGAPNPGGDAVLRALHDDLAEQPEAPGRLIVFLGDNAYPRGLPPAGSPDRAEAERRLLAQVEVGADTSTPTIFIPGNHDWDASGTDGWNAVRRQEEFVERSGVGRVRFDPDGGCPGPVALDVGNSLRLVLIDTEWWLRPTGKPMDPSSACRMDSEAEILEGLGRTIADAGERAVVVTGHHPLATGGAHGGYFRLREHVFPLRDWKSWAWIPLPVIGSIYPIARRRGVTDQDFSGGLNRAMRMALDSTLAAHPPLAYVSGHSHGLEVLDAGPRAGALIVSGAGFFGHVDPIRWGADTRFAASGRSGFVKLEVEQGGRARIAVITVDAKGQRTEAYAEFLEEPR